MIYCIYMKTSSDPKSTPLHYYLPNSSMPSMDSTMPNEELLRRAHGEDVLSDNECARLIQLAAARKKKRFQFFNGRDGWLLRRTVRKHSVICFTSQYCALCSSSNVDDVFRTKVKSVCSKCHVHLCTIPREGEEGLSCMESWLQCDVLEPRIYYSSPA